MTTAINARAMLWATEKLLGNMSALVAILSSCTSAQKYNSNIWLQHVGFELAVDSLQQAVSADLWHMHVDPRHSVRCSCKQESTNMGEAQCS
eukprot:UN4152